MNDDLTPLYEQPEIHARRWFLLGVMCLSLVMVVMSVSGLNVAIPTLQESLGATATDLQWIVDSYAIVFAGLLLSAGAIGDRFGRKRALQAGLAVFLVGSLVGTLADSVELVIVARVVGGVGAAFIMPATLSIISAVFPPYERVKAIAIWAGFAGAGAALGPLIVGFLITDWWIFPAYWWGSAFLVNVVTSAIVLAAVTVYSPRSKDTGATPLDPTGAVLSIIGFAGLLYGIIEGPVKGWTDGSVLTGFVLAAVTLTGFVAWELRAEHPMLPMSYFRDRGFSLGTGVITLGFLVMFGFFFVFTQLLQFVRGYSPLDAGVATLPMAFTLVLVSPRSAALGERFGPGRIMAAGFCFIVAGMGVMSTIDRQSSYLVIAAGLVLLGAGMGITVAPATGSIMSAVPLNKAGVGSAVNDTTREVGGALGIAVFGSIANATYRNSIDAAALSALPAEAAAVVEESVGGALRVAAQAPSPDLAERLADAARGAFESATSATFTASAIVAAGAAVLVFFAGRHYRPDHHGAPVVARSAAAGQADAGTTP